MLRFTMICLLIPASVTAAPPLLLVSKEKQERYAQFLPETTDPWFENLKPQMAFYDKEVMPPAYQFNGGVHAPSYNISAVKPQEKFGNANVEFPWGEPGGLMPDANARSIKFVVFPKGLKIRHWRDAGRDAPIIQWVYPIGTVFGEILTITDKNGYDHTFEVRVRKLEDSGWDIQVYRPFSSPEEMEKEIWILSLRPKWRKNKQIKVFLSTLKSGSKISHSTISDRDIHPNESAFEQKALVEELEPLPEELVKETLRTVKFRPVANRVWRRRAELLGYAPTTKAEFHFVPKDYYASHIPLTVKGCMNCHNSVAKHARDFDQARDWYGHVRGSHRIFSFHIFDPSCISYNGFVQSPVFNRALAEAGLMRDD